MKRINRILPVLFSSIAALTPASAQTGNTYLQTNLVSNIRGTAAVLDPNLVDPWGISYGGTGPFWVSNHLSATSTLYNGQGVITPQSSLYRWAPQTP